jgi:signal transduction histidine kinase
VGTRVHSGKPVAQYHSELAEQPAGAARRAERFAEGGDRTEVAAILRQHRHEILAQWLEISRRQPFHSGRPGRAVAGLDLPLFDAVVDVLEQAATRWIDSEPVLYPAVLEMAQRHAQARFEQGLQATDVLTEFRLLRQEIGRALRLYLPDEVATRDVIAAELLVHDALDGAIGLALAALGRELEELREDVLATTVHDIQQPISGLKARLQLALRTLATQEPDHERTATLIRQAVDEVDRMSAMLRTLGSASRVALGRLDPQPEPTDLRGLVQAAFEHLGPEIVTRCRVDIPPEVTTIGRDSWQELPSVLPTSMM